MNEPILDPQAQAEAARATRRKTLQSWGYALAGALFLAVKIWSRTRHDSGPNSPISADNPFLKLAPFMGAASALLAVGALETNAFTFRYDRPVWRFLKLRIQLSSIGVLLTALFAFIPVEEQLALPLGLHGLETKIPLVVFALVATIALVLGGESIERSVIGKRLRARGLGDEELWRGSIVTLAEAHAQIRESLWKEFEAGLLWLEAGELRFTGDKLDLRAKPGQVRLRREVIPGTFGALLGRKGLLLTLPSEDGELDLRITPQGALTLGAWTAGIERIDAQLTEWQSG